MIGTLAAAAILFTAQDAPQLKPLRPVQLTDVVGTVYQAPKPSAKASVFLFIAVDCPIANRYAPELRKIIDEYREKEVAFFLIYVDPTFSSSDIKEHITEYKLHAPAILDAKHSLVNALGITVTPEAAVVAPDGTVKYRGRINDANLDHGKFRQATRDDLRISLDEVLAGKAVGIPLTRAVGCDIPDIK